MRRASLWTVACALTVGLVCLVAPPTSAAVSVATNDGLVLTLNDDGSWNSLTVDGNPIPQTSNPAGFRVESAPDVPGHREKYFAGTGIVGTATQEGANVRLQASAESLDFDILLIGGGPYIEVDGSVTCPSAEDRTFIVYFRIPVDADGWLWHKDIATTQTIDTRNWFFNPYVFQQQRHPQLSDNPFGSITKTTSPEMGLSLSPLFYPPCAYAVRYYDEAGFMIEFELGTSAKTTKHPNSADFHFVLYQHDPDWGQRSAQDRFYSFFPQWFEKVAKDGNWMDDYGIRPTDPQDFSIVWFETYLWDTPWVTDNDIYGCKYTEAWCQHIVWDESEIEQKALDIPENDDPAPYGTGQSTKEYAQSAIISTSCHPDQGYIGPDESMWEDPDWGEGVSWRWITNPDIEVPNWRNFTINGEPGRNRGESIEYWGWYREWGQDPGPGDVYSGLYHDSVGNWWSGWTIVKNYCDYHWPYYDYNLIIDYDRGLPAMCATYSNVEHLKLAYEQMALEDRVVMANSGDNLEGQTAYELFMCAPWLDMIGDEEFRTGEDHNNRMLRSIAGQKPISYLMGGRTEAAILELMPYGIYPGFEDGSNFDSYRTLFTQYMPILDTITAAGWEPITNARSSDTDMVLERFGPETGGTVYLVLRAPSRGSTDITVSSEEMGWSAYPDVTVTEVIYGDPVSTSYDGNGDLVISTGTVSRKDDRVYQLVPTTGPQPPVAEFSGNPTIGDAPLTVMFTDLSTNSPTAWDWTFGDGGTSAAQNPSHDYTSADDYTVSLTAYNAQGQDTETKPDYISVTTGQPPVADFSGSPTSGTAPLTVDFTDLSSNSPTSWAWTFGDGGTSGQQNPSHQYAEGDYTVSLTATNSYGQDTETKTDYISVSSGGGGDYSCDSIVVETGSLVSGDYISVHASDDSYLEIQSAKAAGKHTAEVTYYYDTGLGSLSSLTVTAESHPSLVPQRQRIWLYDFTTSQYVELDVRDVDSTSDVITVLPISSPSPYLSGSGEVRVRMRQGERLTKDQWNHFIDLVKITAAP